MLNTLARKVLPRQLQPMELARQNVRAKSRGRVMGGPFDGMIYITSPDDFMDYTMLLGTYEKELHPAIAVICAKPPSLVVDVGAAQGYYAVGFALRCPSARVIAFESSQTGRDQIARKAAANNVADRVQILGHCTAELLRDSLGSADDALVFMDIEGGEKEVLDPAIVPGLRRSRIIVEEHSNFVPGLNELLKERFASTHDIRVLPSQPRTQQDLKVDSPLLHRWYMRMLSEGRSGSGGWLTMMPR